MSQRTVLITQSNYIPWKGYFDMIHRADVLVLYDDMQYTKRDWRNRNKIKTHKGTQWLSVPVQVKGKFDQKISETKLTDHQWIEAHWKTICQYYSKAPHFKTYEEQVRETYEKCRNLEYLSQINRLFIEEIQSMLGSTTEICWSSDFSLAEERTQRLVDICLDLEGNHYITGPAAQAYMDEERFQKAGIEIEYFDYSGYPEYPQLHGDFEHGVTILDLLFSVGGDAPKYMKTFN